MGTYGWRQAVCVVVKVDGDADCNAWMVLHGMVATYDVSQQPIVVHTGAWH